MKITNISRVFEKKKKLEIKIVAVQTYVWRVSRVLRCYRWTIFCRTTGKKKWTFSRKPDESARNRLTIIMFVRHRTPPRLLILSGTTYTTLTDKCAIFHEIKVLVFRVSAVLHQSDTVPLTRSQIRYLHVLMAPATKQSRSVKIQWIIIIIMVRYNNENNNNCSDNNHYCLHFLLRQCSTITWYSR